MQAKIKNGIEVEKCCMEVIEYTTRDTPQQNFPVEVVFYALANKACTTMHHANPPMEMKYQVYGEIVNPNRDSPNGYPTVTPTELQPVTLAH